MIICNNNKKLQSGGSSISSVQFRRKKQQQHRAADKYRRYHQAMIDTFIVGPVKFIIRTCRSVTALLRSRKNYRGGNIAAARFLLLVLIVMLALLILLLICQPYFRYFIRSSHYKSNGGGKSFPSTISNNTISSHYDYSPMFDPSTEFTSKEWLEVQQSLPKATKRRALLLWPTIPVILKGSDTRATDTIEFLSHHLGYTVELLVWTEYAIESLDPSYDTTLDIQRVRAAGVHNILGPLDRMHQSASSKLMEDLFSSSRSGPTTAAQSNIIIIVWLWPDTCYLQAIIPFIQRCKQYNGNVRVISVVDDIGIASRYLIGATLTTTTTNDATSTNAPYHPLNDYILQQKQQIQAFVMEQRPPFLRGIDYHQNSTNYSIDPTKPNESRRIQKTNKYGITLLYQEMYLYYMSDMAVGINEETTQFITQMAPGIQLFQKLVYVSPMQPSGIAESTHDGGTSNTSTDRKNNYPALFNKRSGYLFFGYNNAANRRGLEWFVKHVIPILMQHQNEDEKFHIAGTVTSNNPICTAACSSSSSCNHNNKYKNLIICHGAISDSELNALIQSVKVAINPILEPSGVATKTCRAMALGTPVVTTPMDGTFTSQNKPRNGSIVCSDEKCFADAIRTYLTYSLHDWKIASEGASNFIQKYFGSGTFMRNWISILQQISSKPIEVVIDATSISIELCCTCTDDDDNKDMIQSSIYWILVTTLSKMPNVHVTIVTQKNHVIYPSIPRVKSVTATATSHHNIDQPSPFLTGFEANLLLRPCSNHSLPSYCGPSCRAIQIHTTSSKRLHLPSPLTKPNKAVDATWVMIASNSSDRHKVLGQQHLLAQNIIIVPVDMFTRSCTSSSHDAEDHFSPQKEQEFINALQTIINKELSKPSHRKPLEFVIPYKLKTCSVGKFLARNYISLARAIRHTAKLCFAPSTIVFLLTVIAGANFCFYLRGKSSAHVLPNILLPHTVHTTNKRSE